MRKISKTPWVPFLFLLSFAACGSSPSGPPPADEYIVDCEAGDAGVPTASDENYAAFLNAEAAGGVHPDACLAPQLSAPTAGATLDRTTPPTFSFLASGPSCARASSRGVQLAACRARGRSGRGVGARLYRAFVGEGIAEAHCAAFSGENYLFRLLHAGESKPVYTAVLSVTSFTPDAAIWQRALAGRGGQTFTLTIERAVFLMGSIQQGPYVQPTPYTFTAAP
jgi:hypothetical protein